MDWNTLLFQIFELCLIPLLGILTNYLVQYIKEKTKDISAKNDNGILNKYTELLSATITNCVIATNQTYVETLKTQGSFDLEAQKKAFEMTYDAVISILSDDAKEYLTNIYGDLKVYITNMIETEVYKNKLIIK